jgi:hypothetical protein
MSGIRVSVIEPAYTKTQFLQALSAARPQLRYTAGPLAGRLRFLRRFAPVGMMDSAIRKQLKLDALTATP